MDAHGCPAIQAGVVKPVVSAHFINGMPAFMQDGINRRQKRVFMVVSGDTHVVVIKAGGKRVLRGAQHTAPGVNSFQFHQSEGQLLLSLNGIIAKGKGFMRSLHILDFVDDRHNLSPHGAEEFITGGHRQAFFKAVQQDIIGFIIRIPQLSHAAVGSNYFFQIGCKHLKVISVLCSDPDI